MSQKATMTWHTATTDFLASPLNPKRINISDAGIEVAYLYHENIWVFLLRLFWDELNLSNTSPSTSETKHK
jgi:hypothetical protein